MSERRTRDDRRVRRRVRAARSRPLAPPQSPPSRSPLFLASGSAVVCAVHCPRSARGHGRTGRSAHSARSQSLSSPHVNTYDSRARRPASGRAAGGGGVCRVYSTRLARGGASACIRSAAWPGVSAARAPFFLVGMLFWHLRTPNTRRLLTVLRRAGDHYSTTVVPIQVYRRHSRAARAESACWSLCWGPDCYKSYASSSYSSTRLHAALVARPCGLLCPSTAETIGPNFSSPHLVKIFRLRACCRRSK